MKRALGVGFCFMAILSFGAATAAAGTVPPNFGQCDKVQDGSGSFSNAGCTLAATPTHAAFEWFDPSVAFTSTGGASTFEAVSANRPACKANSSVGKTSGEKQVVGLVLTFTGCESGSLKCNSPETLSGEVVTNPLEGILGVTKEGETKLKDKVGLAIFPVGKTGLIATISCAGLPISIRGSVILPVKTNKMLLTETIKVVETKGEQSADKFVGEGTDAQTLELNTNGGPFGEAGLKLETVLTNAEKLEINTVV